MFRTVEIPLWLLILVLLFAAVTALSHVLVPPVRWFFRRRMERVVAQLNTRLERPIQPFKLARRHDMIQRLIYDPQVAQAVADHARATGLREDVAFAEAARYAREIVPTFSATAYFGFAIRAARWLSTRLYRVRTTGTGEAELAAIDAEATIIFVMNHRSNMDYVLVTWLAAERSALRYAVGEWARVWPLSELIRAMGAYFIRRRARTPLYRRVLARYVQLATAAGVTQAIFPEGGLTLDGRVAPARLGLLNYIVSDFDPARRDVVFVPVALNYDRVVEDRILVEADQTGERRFRGSLRTGTAFALRWAWRRVTGKARRFGNAAVALGRPLSLAGFRAGPGELLTEALAAELMRRINDEMPVLPVPLVALILLGAGAPLTREEVAARAAICVRELPDHLTQEAPARMAEAGVGMLLLRRLVEERDGRIAICQGQIGLVRFYAASVAHHWAEVPDVSPHPAEDRI